MSEFKQAIVDAYGQDAALDMLLSVLDSLPVAVNVEDSQSGAAYANAAAGAGSFDASAAPKPAFFGLAGNKRKPGSDQGARSGQTQTRLELGNGSTVTIRTGSNGAAEFEGGDEFRRLLSENEIFRSLVEHLPVSVYVRDADMRLVYANPAWSELTGVKSLGGRMVMGFIGGFILLLGARIAGGCTSGHCISGGLQLAVSGWVFMIALFAVGIPAAMMIYKKRS